MMEAAEDINNQQEQEAESKHEAERANCRQGENVLENQSGHHTENGS